MLKNILFSLLAVAGTLGRLDQTFYKGLCIVFLIFKIFSNKRIPTSG